LKENKYKSGVYRWINLANNKSYVGSGANLSKRLSHYYSDKYLETQLKKGKSVIYSAILKYGRNNFKLEILEYCEPTVVLKREQQYINSIKPEYNILQKAGNSLGRMHTEESKQKMSEAQKGKTLTEESKKKISVAMFGNKKFLGKTHSEVSKAKISEARGTTVKVLDLNTNETSIFSSMNKAAKALGVTQPALSKRFVGTTDSFVLKGRYQITKIE